MKGFFASCMNWIPASIQELEGRKQKASSETCLFSTNTIWNRWRSQQFHCFSILDRTTAFIVEISLYKIINMKWLSRKVKSQYKVRLVSIRTCGNFYDLAGVTAICCVIVEVIGQVTAQRSHGQVRPVTVPHGFLLRFVSLVIVKSAHMLYKGSQQWSPHWNGW